MPPTIWINSMTSKPLQPFTCPTCKKKHPATTPKNPTTKECILCLSKKL